MIWSQEQDAELVRLLRMGYTAQQIGAAMGASRNSVIGRTYRLEEKHGLLDRRRGPRKVDKKVRNGSEPPPARINGKLPPTLAAIAAVKRPVMEPRAVRRAPVATAKAKPFKPPAGPGKHLTFRYASPAPKPVVGRGIRRVAAGTPCGILQLSGCRFPVGESESVIGRHLFCNAPLEEGHSYCEHHAVVVVNPDSRALIRRTMRAAAP